MERAARVIPGQPFFYFRAYSHSDKALFALSFSNALSWICLTRSLVMPRTFPVSSSVWMLSPERP